MSLPAGKATLRVFLIKRTDKKCPLNKSDYPCLYMRPVQKITKLFDSCGEGRLEELVLGSTVITIAFRTTWRFRIVDISFSLCYYSVSARCFSARGDFCNVGYLDST